VKRNPHAGGLRNCGIGLTVLSEDELDDIHLSALEVLERTGVFVESSDALDIYADGGCRVDREQHIAKIPPCVVEEAIRSAPPRFTLCGRDTVNDISLESGRVGFTNFSTGVMVIDLETGEYRESTRQDLLDIGRLNDYLSDIDTFEVAVEARDVPAETAAIHNFEAMVLSSTKPVSAEPLDSYEMHKIIEMATVVAGGEDELRARPILYFEACPVSPLKLHEDVTDVIIGSARAGLPDNIISMAMAGASGPVSLAGTLVTHNAEVLAGVTLAQLVVRGSPVFYGSSTTAMDLRLAQASVGSPECAMISAAVAQLARRYCLPSFVAGL
jgi:trimethylamine--corrinoid protein Co-methyltransferase